MSTGSRAADTSGRGLPTVLWLTVTLASACTVFFDNEFVEPPPIDSATDRGGASDAIDPLPDDPRVEETNDGGSLLDAPPADTPHEVDPDSTELEDLSDAALDDGDIGVDPQCLGGTLCGEDCLDLASDEQNCGACGLACGLNEICNGGRCDCDGLAGELGAGPICTGDLACCPGVGCTASCPNCTHAGAPAGGPEVASYINAAQVTYLTENTAPRGRKHALVLQLFYELGASDSPGDYQPFTFVGTNYAGCRVCSLAFRDCGDSVSADRCAKTFWLESGTLDLTSLGRQGDRLTGMLADARYVLVTLDDSLTSTVVDVNEDGEPDETWCVESHAFDIEITAP